MSSILRSSHTDIQDSREARSMSVQVRVYRSIDKVMCSFPYRNTKAISITEAEKIISNFQKPTTLEKKDKKELKSTSKNKAKLKKISKK